MKNVLCLYTSAPLFCAHNGCKVASEIASRGRSRRRAQARTMQRAQARVAKLIARS